MNKYKRLLRRADDCVVMATTAENVQIDIYVTKKEARRLIEEYRMEYEEDDSSGDDEPSATYWLNSSNVLIIWLPT